MYVSCILWFLQIPGSQNGSVGKDFWKASSPASLLKESAFTDCWLPLMMPLTLSQQLQEYLTRESGFCSFLSFSSVSQSSLSGKWDVGCAQCHLADFPLQFAAPQKMWHHLTCSASEISWYDQHFCMVGLLVGVIPWRWGVWSVMCPVHNSCNVSFPCFTAWLNNGEREEPGQGRSVSVKAN